MEKLNRDFYLRDTLTVAKELLGKTLVRKTEEGTVKGRITETEAYIGTAGSGDKACHAYPEKHTKRTEIMFSEGGHTYVYLIYGMYCCLNIVSNIAGKPEAVLIRAIEPTEGLDIIKKRRKTDKNLCNGPGKLCMAFDINREDNGTDLCGDDIYIEDDGTEYGFEASKRINIDYAEEAKDFLWRFTIRE